jgi:hypothetical protein
VNLTATLRTDSGMHVVWDRSHFLEVHDYQTWEHELLEEAELLRHIAEGHLVPININSDGAFTITVRADPGQIPEMSPEEQGRTLALSEPYRFHCVGHIDISGIEYVTGAPAMPEVVSESFPAGEYESRVCLLDWDDFAVRTDRNPDFVVLLGPSESDCFRRSVTTFDRQ